MTIVAKISSTELTEQVSARFSGAYIEARLINASNTAYVPGVTVDSDFLGFEVAEGTGGYKRQTIRYEAADVLAYSDDGVPLDRKATVFPQDGGATTIDFSHVALVWSAGNVTSLGAVGTSPSAGVDGTYTNIPVSSSSGDIRETDTYATSTAFTASQTSAAVTVTGGSGSGATGTVDTDASGNVTNANISGGLNFVVGDTITITESGGTPGVATAVVRSISGGSLTVDLTITNSGAASTDYAVTVARPGYNYKVGEVLNIADGVLAGLGAISGGAGDLAFTVAAISGQSNAGQLLTVAQTANDVVLSGGNEAVFYWDLKQFGFYST